MDGPTIRPGDLGAVFCPWREEMRDGKATKPPLNPRTGRYALNNDSRTWGTQAQAEARRDRLGDAAPKGIGLMLHPLPDRPGWRLIGLDLDSCRDPATGDLAWWAPPIVERFAAYTEPSPSGTGLRVLAFARDEDVEALRATGLILPDAKTGGPGAGRKFALSGEHREIALAVERQFYAYTARPLPGHDLIRPVSLDVLTWLLGEHGPQVQVREGRHAQGGGAVATGTREGRDESGSGYGLRFLLAAFRAGASEEAAVRAIGEDRGPAGEWWARASSREQDRAVRHAQANVARALDALLEEFPEMIDVTPEEPPAHGIDAEIESLLWGAPEGAVSIIPPAARPAPVRSAQREAADRQAPYSDTWAGAKHADRQRGARLFVSATAQWLAQTGERWAAQTAEDVAADAKATSAAVYAEAQRACGDNPSGENQARLRKAAALHGSAAALARMVESSRSEAGMHVASPAEFDRDPDLLATPSGLLNLRDGSLRPARPEDMVSKLAGAPYIPDAPAPLWDAFLATVQPDPEMRAFIQRLAGWSLTGNIGEERFVLLSGSGSNGKSVFANVLKRAWGEFARSFNSALVTKGRSASESDRQVAGLPGLRLALVDETSPGDIFDGARVKSLASREDIAARKLYAEGFDFTPTHHLWIRTNHRPGSHDATDGFWRRCLPVPFKATIPEEARVPDLDRRIVAQELPGVLAWAVRGAVEWHRGGLRVPASVKADVASYRRDTDLLGGWLEERTVPETGGFLPSGAAYADFRAYCEDMNVSPGSGIAFGRSLAERGHQKAPDTSKRGFVGLRLRPHEPHAQEGFASAPAQGGDGAAPKTGISDAETGDDLL